MGNGGLLAQVEEEFSDVGYGDDFGGDEPALSEPDAPADEDVDDLVLIELDNPAEIDSEEVTADE